MTTPVGPPFGDLTISSGQTVDGISDGGGTITDYGTAKNAYIELDGVEFVYGSAINTTLHGSSSTDIFGDTILHYAYQYVEAGGSATVTTVEFNGFQYILSSGTANSTFVKSGGAEFVSGTDTGGTVVFSGGAQYIEGGTAIGTIVNTGGAQYIDQPLPHESFNG